MADKGKTALVLVDFVFDVIDEGGKFAGFGIAGHAKERDTVKNTQKLLRKARSSGIRIIHVKVEYASGYPELKGTKMPMYAQMSQTGALLKGTAGAEIIADLRPLAGEYTVTKSRITPFSNPVFEKTLKGYGIETVILAGVATNFAVEETAREAAQKDYAVIVAEDCCASLNEQMHEFSIKSILPNFALVKNGDEIASSL